MEENPIQKQFLESYDELSDAIFRHCFFRVSDREVALDLMQDTFLKTWKYLQKGNDIYDIKAFLYKTANNLIIDHYRRKKFISFKLNQEETFQISDDSHQNIISQSEFNLVVRKIEDLEESYKRVIIMRYIDGLSPQEIAEITSLSANNVSVRIARGLQKLKEKME